MNSLQEKQRELLDATIENGIADDDHYLIPVKQRFNAYNQRLYEASLFLIEAEEIIVSILKTRDTFDKQCTQHELTNKDCLDCRMQNWLKRVARAFKEADDAKKKEQKENDAAGQD